MISSDELNLLLRLSIGYLVSTLVFTPVAWRQHIREKKIRSPFFYLQALLVAVLVWLCGGNLAAAWTLPLIFTGYAAIRTWKIYRPENALSLIIEAALHLSLILFTWLLLTNTFGPLSRAVSTLLSDTRTLAVLLAYSIVIWPLGALIGIATERWRNEPGVNTDGLAKAGLWIGIYERFLILTFILLDQFTAIGFLIAAKSVLRFNDKESGTQKKTEYVLIGTLMSFSASLITGLAIRWLIG